MTDLDVRMRIMISTLRGAYQESGPGSLTASPVASFTTMVMLSPFGAAWAWPSTLGFVSVSSEAAIDLLYKYCVRREEHEVHRSLFLRKSMGEPERGIPQAGWRPPCPTTGQHHTAREHDGLLGRTESREERSVVLRYELWRWRA